MDVSDRSLQAKLTREAKITFAYFPSEVFLRLRAFSTLWGCEITTTIEIKKTSVSLSAKAISAVLSMSAGFYLLLPAQCFGAPDRHLLKSIPSMGRSNAGTVSQAEGNAGICLCLGATSGASCENKHRRRGNHVPATAVLNHI